MVGASRLKALTVAQVLLSIPDGRAVKTQPPAAGATANGKT